MQLLKSLPQQASVIKIRGVKSRTQTHHLTTHPPAHPALPPAMAEAEGVAAVVAAHHRRREAVAHLHLQVLGALPHHQDARSAVDSTLGIAAQTGLVKMEAAPPHGQRRQRESRSGTRRHLPSKKVTGSDSKTLMG